MQQLIDYIERFVRLDSEAILALENLPSLAQICNPSDCNTKGMGLVSLSSHKMLHSNPRQRDEMVFGKRKFCKYF